MYTVYDCVYDDSLAKNLVYAPYSYVKFWPALLM